MGKTNVNHAVSLGLPEKEPKRLLQIEVSQDLFEVVDAERRRRGLTKRKLVEWGFKSFLVAFNKSAAKQLGILED